MSRTVARSRKLALILLGLGLVVLVCYWGYQERPIMLHPQPPAVSHPNVPAPPPPVAQSEAPEAEESAPERPGPAHAESKAPESASRTHRLRPGQVLGDVKIPRLHVAVKLVEGTAERQLRHGAGHVPGTALPGLTGNIAIAAHRDRWFRALRNIQSGDEILVDTPEGEYRYQVRSTEIVRPNDVAVLRQSTDPELTLITCYPFYYVGHAPKRFIVHAVGEGQTEEAAKHVSRPGEPEAKPRS